MVRLSKQEMLEEKDILSRLIEDSGSNKRIVEAVPITWNDLFSCVEIEDSDEKIRKALLSLWIDHCLYISDEELIQMAKGLHEMNARIYCDDINTRMLEREFLRLISDAEEGLTYGNTYHTNYEEVFAALQTHLCKIGATILLSAYGRNREAFLNEILFKHVVTKRLSNGVR